ncbi:hypothetical protein [Amycolatopsis benzoatilytica]|uniref:hypothetical protein n=1 Tax=Amycolatopsis benzoatilytica TaxID=346045 RepID=UPI000371FF39|nr:hypothetical protein [Amycolatopsis benzoatilytica]
MSFFDTVGDVAKAVGGALEDAADWVGDRASDVAHWFGDLYHGNLGDNAVPAPELVAKILASQGAQSWHQGAQQATQLAGKHDEAGARVQQLSAGLESAWTGGGADAAQARIRPFADATTAAASTYTGNGQNLTDLAHGFDAMKQSLQPMPGAPPHKNVWDEVTPWDTDTEDQINQYNKTAQENLDRYHGYTQHAQTSGQTLATDYGQLSAFDGDVTLSKPGTNSTGGPDDRHGTDSRSRSGFGPADTGGGPSSAFTPSYPGSTGSTPSGPGSGGHVPTYQPPNQPVGAGSGDGTTAAGWTPPDLSRSTGPGAGWVPSPSIPGGGGTGGGNSWSPGVAGGFGPTGGFGSGGGAFESGGGAGTGGRGGSAAGRLGGGAGTGGAAEGAEGAAGRGSSAAGARGAAGSRGGAGMGGMGAGGGKGKGEEDKEHQRKYLLEDDSAFDLVDDEDGRLRDPRTGLPPTPPTIGG